MSIITWPSTLRVPADCTISQARYDIVENSDPSGSQASRLFGPTRWRIALRSVDAFTLTEAGQWEALLLKLRGGVNRLAVYDPVRTAPQGTMRGTLTLSTDPVIGAASIVITGGAGQASKTLLAGDWLGIGSGIGTSQLVKVVDDATANGSGVITVNIEPPLRIDFAAGASVTWDKPLGYFRQTSDPQWSYRAGLRMRQSGFAIDMLEAFS